MSDRRLGSHARSNNQHEPIRERGDRTRIGNHGRRRIDDDAIELGSKTIHQPPHWGRSEHLSRVIVGSAGSQHGEVVVGQLDQRVCERHPTGQQIHEPGSRRQSEQLVDGRTPEIGID